MVKIYNPNCKMASVKIHDEVLFKHLKDHFLTFVHKPDPVFGSILENDIVITATGVESVLRSLKEIALMHPTKENIDREIVLKGLAGVNGMMFVSLVSKEMFDEIEPIQP